MMRQEASFISEKLPSGERKKLLRGWQHNLVPAQFPFPSGSRSSKHPPVNHQLTSIYYLPAQCTTLSVTHGYQQYYKVDSRDKRQQTLHTSYAWVTLVWRQVLFIKYMLLPEMRQYELLCFRVIFFLVFLSILSAGIFVKTKFTWVAMDKMSVNTLLFIRWWLLYLE